MSSEDVFHVKRGRPITLVLLLAMLSLGAIACAAGESARGWAAPVPNGDIVVISTGKGRLDAINVETRLALWRFPNNWDISLAGADKLKGIYATPVFSQSGDTLFVGDYNGHVYAFRPEALGAAVGKPPAAALKLDDPVLGGLVLDAATDTLYVTAGDRLHALKTSDLERRIENRDAAVETRWPSFKAGDEIWSKPVLHNGRIFVTSLDGNLYALDQQTGAEIWRFNSSRSLISTPVVVGKLLLVGGFDDRLYAVDIATGKSRWQFKASNWVWGAPLVSGGYAYVGDFDGDVHAVDLQDGRALWSMHVADQPIVASPVLAGGILVIAAQDGLIYGLDPETQTLRWQQPADVLSGINADLAAEDETVYVAPKGCATPPGSESKTYYFGLNALTGAAVSSPGVC